MLGGATYVFINNFSDAGSVQKTEGLVGQTSGSRVPDGLTSQIGEIEKTNIESLLNNLVRFGNWPVTAGDLGRSNPFQPTF